MQGNSNIKKSYVLFRREVKQTCDVTMLCVRVFLCPTSNFQFVDHYSRNVTRTLSHWSATEPCAKHPKFYRNNMAN